MLPLLGVADLEQAAGPASADSRTGLAVEPAADTAFVVEAAPADSRTDLAAELVAEAGPVD